MPATFGDGLVPPRELRSSATLLRLTDSDRATAGLYHALPAPERDRAAGAAADDRRDHDAIAVRRLAAHVALIRRHDRDRAGEPDGQAAEHRHVVAAEALVVELRDLLGGQRRR